MSLLATFGRGEALIHEGDLDDGHVAGIIKTIGLKPTAIAQVARVRQTDITASRCRWT